MSTNDFDKIIKDKFNEHEFAFEPENWERLSRALPNERHSKKILPWITGLAASVALLAGGYWYFFKAATPQTIAVNHKTEEQRNANPTVVKQAIQHEEAPLLPTEKKDLATIAPNTRQRGVAKPVKTPAEETSSTTENTSYSEPYEKNQTVNPTFLPQQQMALEASASSKVADPVKSITTKPENPIFSTLSEDENETPVTRSNKTIISLAGGMNYGTMNTAFGATLNAKHKLGSKIFIEGDLGVMRNEQVTSVSMSTMQFSNYAAGNRTARPVKLYEKNSNFHYMQLTPTVGYQVAKNISVGIGADLQKLLEANSGNRPIVATDNGLKLVPLWDAGITGKTEYTISKRLKAGILYREGINNLLVNDNRYFDRRYLQVQLKLKLFGK
jgi:hypothetical protein